MWRPRVRNIGAGYVERLLVRALASDLKRGEMRTRLNGSIVPEATARRMVARARMEGA